MLMGTRHESFDKVRVPQMHAVEIADAYRSATQFVGKIFEFTNKSHGFNYSPSDSSAMRRISSRRRAASSNSSEAMASSSL